MEAGNNNEWTPNLEVSTAAIKMGMPFVKKSNVKENFTLMVYLFIYLFILFFWWNFEAYSLNFFLLNKKNANKMLPFILKTPHPYFENNATI